MPILFFFLMNETQVVRENVLTDIYVYSRVQQAAREEKKRSCKTKTAMSDGYAVGIFENIMRLFY